MYGFNFLQTQKLWVWFFARSKKPKNVNLIFLKLKKLKKHEFHFLCSITLKRQIWILVRLIVKANRRQHYFSFRSLADGAVVRKREQHSLSLSRIQIMTSTRSRATQTVTENAVKFLTSCGRYENSISQTSLDQNFLILESVFHLKSFLIIDKTWQ